MNKRILSVILILIGLLVIIVNAQTKPFDSGFDGPIALLFEFAGPLVFTLGAMIFGYELLHYKKEGEWPEEISNKFLVFTIIMGLVASALIFIYRLL
jgi:hypothetical protein